MVICKVRSSLLPSSYIISFEGCVRYYPHPILLRVAVATLCSRWELACNQGVFLTLPDHGDDGARLHVLDEGGEEGLGGEVAVVRLEEFLRGNLHLEGDLRTGFAVECCGREVRRGAAGSEIAIDSSCSWP